MPEEPHQLTVDLFPMRPRDIVRSILDHHQLRTFYQLGRALPGGREWHNPVRVAVDYERRHIDPREIVAEIFMPRWNARQARDSRRDASHIPACLHRLLADPLPKVNVGVVEVLEEFGEERVAVLLDRGRC